MRWRERWPLLFGAGLAIVTLVLMRWTALGTAGLWTDVRVLGIGVTGWAIAAIALAGGLVGQMVLASRASFRRERRLVYTGAALREATARLERQATTDTLTGLANRRLFSERLAVEYRRAVRYDRPLAALMVDIDHFKRVNDEHGHPFGDIVLAGAARAVRASVRESDLVARYGGEEFLLMLPETGLEQAMVVAEKLRSAIAAQEFTDGTTSMRVTISVGVATLPECAPRDEEHLVALADEALYEAKRGGRDRAVAAAAVAPPAAPAASPENEARSG